MKAMILSAGLGTRLLPLTEKQPKALVRVMGIPMIEIIIKRLIKYGFREIIINVHHFADKIEEFIEQEDHFGIRIVFANERDMLLDTGGGIKNARWFLEGKSPFLVHNVDVLSDIDLRSMTEHHNRSGALATLGTMSRRSSRYLLFKKDGILAGWKNIRTGEEMLAEKTSSLSLQAFSGIHIIQPEIFNYFGEERVFSITQFYLEHCRESEIISFNHDDSFWLDMGKKSNLARAEAFIKNNPNFIS